MTDPEDKRFELLMSEKNLVDSHVTGFFDLQVKLIGFLSAATILLGWLYADKAKPIAPAGFAVICISLVVISCSVNLLCVALWGSSLGYLEYKMNVLNREFARLLSLSSLPFTNIWWRLSRAKAPVYVAIFSLFGMQAVVNGLLLYMAATKGQPIPQFRYVVMGTTAYFALTIVAEVLIVLAFRTFFRGDGTSVASHSDGATTDTSAERLSR